MAIMGITFSPEAVISVSPNFPKDDLSLLYPTITEALAKADELAGYRKEQRRTGNETELDFYLAFKPVIPNSFKLYLPGEVFIA